MAVRFNKSLAFLIIALLVSFGTFMLAHSKSSEVSLVPGQEVSIERDRIVVRAGSRLLNHLEIAELGAGGFRRSGFKMVGQIIALANPAVECSRSSGEAGCSVTWVELDKDLSREIGLNLDRLASSKVGDVIGLTTLPLSYATKVGPGQQVEVSHYGLNHGSESATILYVRLKTLLWGDGIPVIFRLSNTQEWLPGTNCEVTFPFIRSQSKTIPTTALLHEGLYDYILRETAPNEFVPSRVTIEDESSESADVITNLSSGDKIVKRGAILLKPYIHQMLEKEHIK